MTTQVTHQTYTSIDEVKKAIRSGVKVYVCYEHKRINHSGMLFWNSSVGYIRRFMGLDMGYDFNFGRNSEPELYYSYA